MSLDQNLFTLRFTPNAEDPTIVDLVDPSGLVYFRKQRVPGLSYRIHVYGPSTEAPLITVSSPSPTSKAKILELYDPPIIIKFTSAGFLSFRWTFRWEEHEFEWRKKECFMIRKPDPHVLVAQSSEPPSRLNAASIQIMDYNLKRFDIADIVNLELIILTALFTFQDMDEAYRAQREERSRSGETGFPLLRWFRPSAVPRPPPPGGAELVSPKENVKAKPMPKMKSAKVKPEKAKPVPKVKLEKVKPTPKVKKEKVKLTPKVKKEKVKPAPKVKKEKAKLSKVKPAPKAKEKKRGKGRGK